MLRKMVILAFALLICYNHYASAQVQSHIPRYDHVIIIIEENHAFHQLIGSPNAPYITKLAKEGALFTNSHGIGHPSQPNYLALFSGNTQNVTGDGCLDKTTPFHTSNLGAALFAKGYTFKGYAQTMPSSGYLGCTYRTSFRTVGHLYARKHTPPG